MILKPFFENNLLCNKLNHWKKKQLPDIHNLENSFHNRSYLNSHAQRFRN